MNQPQPSFVYNIPSIHQKRPLIPAALGNLDLNRRIAAGDPLSYQPVIHAKSVATVLQGLRGEFPAWLKAQNMTLPFIDSGDPVVTEDMVKISAARAVAVDSACKLQVFLKFVTNGSHIPDAASEFTPQNIVQTLHQINGRLGNMEDRLEHMDNRLGNVENHLGNIDINIRNLSDDVQVTRAQSINVRTISRNRFQTPNDLEPLQKTVRVVCTPLVKFQVWLYH